MMFRLAVQSAVFVATVSAMSFDANSKAASKLMSQARRLNQQQNEDFSWLAGYSVKFQGCHHSLAWNEDADGQNEARIYTQRLVRFRLCPSDYCSGVDSSSGCDPSTAAEYVVNMAAFVEAYNEAQEDAQEYACEQARETCENDECANADDDEACEQNCLQEAGMEDCIENEDEEEFEIQQFLECAEYDGGNRRKLNDGKAYYIGPYCSSEGDKIHLGMFTDDTCSVAASSDIYSALSYGNVLPYSEDTGNSLVQLDCVSCKEPQQNQNQDDQQDQDEVIGMCEEIYELAGKCESNISDVVYYPNEDACTFIKGIQINREDFTVDLSKSNKKATVFIGIFALTTVLLGAYVYNLKSKLDRASVNLQ